MARPHPDRIIIIIGAGAAGLMAARELARAGKRVTIPEARDRCGGRIHPLPSADFGYPAEGGAEFVHGEAPVTHGLFREAGLSLLPIHRTQWTVEDGKFSREEPQDPHEAELHKALQELKEDLTVAEFLARHFAGPQYDRLRLSIERMVEGYDAADPERASTLALREEWMDGGRNTQARIIGGYGALVDFLTAECRNHGVAIHLGSAVSAIEASNGRGVVRRANGAAHECDAVGPHRASSSPEGDSACSGGTREGRSGCTHRLWQRPKDPCCASRPVGGSRSRPVAVLLSAVYVLNAVG
jgi:phytoene dehydrogenase-like protein